MLTAHLSEIQQRKRIKLWKAVSKRLIALYQRSFFSSDIHLETLLVPLEKDHYTVKWQFRDDREHNPKIWKSHVELKIIVTVTHVNGAQTSCTRTRFQSRGHSYSFWNNIWAESGNDWDVPLLVHRWIVPQFAEGTACIWWSCCCREKSGTSFAYNFFPSISHFFISILFLSFPYYPFSSLPHCILQDIDTSRTSIINVFKDNFWGDPMTAPTSRHQVFSPTYWSVSLYSRASCYLVIPTYHCAFIPLDTSFLWTRSSLFPSRVCFLKIFVHFIYLFIYFIFKM